jgi:hypothetical protein
MIRAVFSFLMLFSLTACNLAVASPGNNPPSQPNAGAAIDTPNPQAQIDAAVSQAFEDQTRVALAVQQTMTAQVTATPSTPSDTPIPSLTPPPPAPMVSVSVETNCRTGPGTVFPALGILKVGQTAEVVGQSVYKDNWIIKLPSDPTVHCWLWGHYATVVGDTSALPSINPPPTPTPAAAFTYAFNSIGVGPGYDCVLFKATNTGSQTFKSYSFTVKDTNLTVSGANTSNDFNWYDSWCTLTASTGFMWPGQTEMVSVTIVFPANPAGTYFDATLTLCTDRNLTGTCLAQRLMGNFGP